MRRLLFSLFSVFIAMFGSVTSAWAFSAPSSGDLWYELYETFYDNIVTGAMGAALVGGVLAWGIMAAVRGALLTFVICSLAAAVFYNLESVVTGFGMIA